MSTGLTTEQSQPTWADGPAGEIPPDTRAPAGWTPQSQQTTEFLTHGCPPGTQYIANLGYINGNPVSGCYPLPCPLPDGFQYAPGFENAPCGAAPPVGWQPFGIVGGPGLAPGAKLHAIVPPQSAQPIAIAGPAWQSPTRPPGYVEGTLSPPGTWEPMFIVGHSASFGKSKYPLVTPGTPWPGAPDYLYISIQNPRPKLTREPPFIPEAPIGYTYTFMLPPPAPTMDVFHFLDNEVRSFTFQYIDSALLVGQQAAQGQQAPAPVQPLRSSPTGPRLERVPAPDPDAAPPRPQVADGRFPGPLPGMDAARTRKVEDLRYAINVDSVCTAERGDFASALKFHMDQAKSRKPAEYPHGEAGSLKPIDRDWSTLGFLLGIAQGQGHWIVDRPLSRATILHYVFGRGANWPIPVSQLLFDVPGFRREYERLRIAATIAAVKHYKATHSSNFVIVGEYAVFDVPSLFPDWFAALHYFTYWYVACCRVGSVGYEQTGGKHITIEFSVLVADRYEFQRTLSPGMPPTPQGGPGDPIKLPLSVKAALKLGALSLPADAMLNSGELPDYFFTGYFYALHTAGLAMEFDSTGSSRIHTFEVAVN